MIETLISLETAKLAKRKGFDEATWEYYYDKDLHSGALDNGMIRWNSDSEYSQELVCAAPTQSLLAKWLRDERGIKVLVDYIGIGSDDYEWGYILKYEQGDAKREYERLKIVESVQFYPGGYSNKVWPNNSYEEALEAGLKEALKLL